MSITQKFSRLGTDNAPGQEGRLASQGLESLIRGEVIEGRPVDFSHGDVDAFTPTPGAFELFGAGGRAGGTQAYTEYRGDPGIREILAPRLSAFTGAPVDAREGLLLAPGTQGALFLSLASTVGRGTKVAVVQPDYFANRKIVEFLEAEMVPVPLDYGTAEGRAGIDLDRLEAAFREGVEVFLFSNPNNPAGVIYSASEIEAIASLAGRYGVTVIVDQLYSRLLYSGQDYVHLRARMPDADNLITIMGPSKTESLSGYRVGVAFGAAAIVGRMEKLQAIVSLRAAGYSQAVLRGWFAEPEGWLAERIRLHEGIRDELLVILRAVPGVDVRAPEAGSYLFPRLPRLAVAYADFVRLLRLQAGVTVTPGTEFSPHAEDCLRLNFSQDPDAAAAAVRRLAVMIERYRA